MSKDSSSSKIAKVPWNVGLALAFIVLIYFGSQIISGLLVARYGIIVQHMSSSEVIDWLDNSIGAQFAYFLIAEATTIGSIYWFLRRYKLGFGIIGLKKPKLSDPFVGAAAFIPYILLYVASVGVISHFVPSLNIDQQQQIGFDNASGLVPLAMTFISLVVLPPLAEEIMVRGFLYSTLKKALPTIWAVLLTSALFASAHLPEGGAAGPLYIAAIDTFVLSLILIYLRERTGRLWAGITLHALKNGIAFTALFVIHAR